MPNGFERWPRATRLSPRILAAVISIFLGSVTMTVAQTDAELSEVPALTARDLEGFLDRFVPEQLQTLHIPGATLAVVKDGRELLAKGYGFADLERKAAVVADRTLFRTGSVAKLLTWTAVMQLVERGKLDLNADVNTYLKTFQIPATFSQPVTLRHLLTHTAGFEDAGIGYARRDPADLEPLGSFVARRIPARIHPPGKFTAYSNYGTTLAGYVVEQVSGIPYERYIRQNLFEPLQMRRSNFEQPQTTFAPDTAKGYVYQSGQFRPDPDWLIQIVPAGAPSATATDMANFMIAHLQGGAFEDHRILQAATVAQMHRQQFTNHPRLSGMGYGFYRAKVQGHNVVEHHGDTAVFRTLLALLPEKGFGLYVAYNAPGGSLARDALLDAVLSRYYPSGQAQPQVQSATTDARRFAGLYLSTRTPHSTIEKIRQLFDPFYQPARVSFDGDGALELHMPAQQSLSPQTYKPSRWLQVAPDAFQRSDGKDTLAFVQHSPAAMFLDSKAPRSYIRLSWFDALMFQPMLPLLCTVGLLLAAGLSLYAVRTAPTPLGGAQLTAHWLTLLSGGTAVVFLLGLAAFVLFGLGALLTGNIPLLLVALLTLGLLLLPLVAGTAVAALMPQSVGLLRVGSGLAGVSGVALLVWLNYWNLLGFHF